MAATSVECIPPAACLGNNTCAAGHACERCSCCAAAHYRPQGNLCTACPESSESLLGAFAIVLVIVSIVFLIGAIKFRRRIERSTVHFRAQFQRHPQVVLKIGWNFLQCIGVIFVLRVDWPEQVRGVFYFIYNYSTFSSDALATDCGESDFLASYGFKLGVRILLPLLLIVIGFVLFGLFKTFSACCRNKVQQVRLADLPNAGISVYTTIHIIVFLSAIEVKKIEELKRKKKIRI